ncbi:efflux transporter outer membrane subunit [Cupriavidus sp. SW-Y-13]|uniref:efflux transporter outer membrane subunit n=1 Tax=Cupriavidus sp. SW-Y-13 TaxID=2653854 RepID=UPI003519F731
MSPLPRAATPFHPMNVRLSARVLALAATLVLTACAVGPDYKTPDTPTQVNFHSAGALAARQATTPVPPLDQWWSGFQDPVLTRIVQRALGQNLDLETSRARVAQARAMARQAGAVLYPEGRLGADVSRQRQSVESPLGKLGSALPGYERNRTVYDVGAAASWEIDVAGGLRRGAEAATADAGAAEAEHAGVQVTVAAEAADAYFRIRGAQRRIVIAEDQIRTDGRLLELVRTRQRDGLSATREVAQAEALVAQARTTLPPLRIELQTQLNRLDVLMGATPGTYAAELAAVSGDPAVPAISLAGGPSALLRRRPDVIAAERRLAASNARIGVALAEYYPKVSLSALLGFESLSTSQLLTARAFQPSAAAGLRWRLFDFGRVDAEVDQAHGAHAQALAQYRLAMLRATEDVENAIVTLAELEVQSGSLATEVDAHRRARTASEDAYKGGAVSLYEVLDEDRQLLASRDQQARVATDNARAAVAAYRALGGGW